MPHLLLFVNIGILAGILYNAYIISAFLSLKEPVEETLKKQGLSLVLIYLVTTCTIHIIAALVLCWQLSWFYRFSGLSILFLYAINVVFADKLDRTHSGQSIHHILIPSVQIAISSIIFLNL